MPFDWNVYLSLACRLANDNDYLKNYEQAVLRTAISRAYYSVFCQAKEKKNITVKDKVHKYVIDAYKNSTNKNEQLIGKELEALRRNRVDADYYKNKNFTVNNVRLLVAKAKRCQGKL